MNHSSFNIGDSDVDIVHKIRENKTFPITFYIESVKKSISVRKD